MVNDPLSDLIARIKNGYQARLERVELPYSKVKEAVARVLAEEGYVREASHADNKLTIELKYTDKEPAIMGINRVSKPGRRVYTGVKNLPRVWGSLGINVLSTPKGIMSHKKAVRLNLGGEIVCQVW